MWVSTRGRGSTTQRPERDLNTRGQSSEARRRRSISQSSERKVKVDEEPGTLRRSLSGYFTASEDFSETDDETPKADHSEPILKSAIKYRTPSDDSRRQIKFRTTEKNPEIRPTKFTPKNPEARDKEKSSKYRDRSRSESRRRTERSGRTPKRGSGEEALTTMMMTEIGTVDEEEHHGGRRIGVGGQGDRDHPHRPEAPTATNPPSLC